MAKEIQITGPVTTVLAELNRSATADVINARHRSRAGWSIVISILLLLGSGIVVSYFYPLGVFMLVVGLVGLIVAIALYVSFNRRDFEDRKRNIVRDFFAVLAQDIPRKAGCKVWLNDDGFLKHGQVSDQTGGTLAAVKTASYEDEWGLLTGRLHDGADFKITIAQVVKRKSRSKRKYTKIKERHQEKVALALRLAPELYPRLAQLPGLLQAGTVGGMKVTRAEVADNVLRIAAVTESVNRFRGRSGWGEFNEQGLVTGRKLLDLFVFIYSQLASARRAEAPPS